MDPIVVPCPACRTLNRLPVERIGDVPVCSSCRSRLLGSPIELNEATFDQVVAGVNLPIVVDFWAVWCAPCRAMAPQFAAAAQELAGAVVFAKVDTEASPRLAARFDVRSIPLLVVLQNGTEVRRTVGTMQKDQLVQWVTGAWDQSAKRAAGSR